MNKENQYFNRVMDLVRAYKNSGLENTTVLTCKKHKKFNEECESCKVALILDKQLDNI